MKTFVISLLVMLGLLAAGPVANASAYLYGPEAQNFAENVCTRTAAITFFTNQWGWPWPYGPWTYQGATSHPFERYSSVYGRVATYHFADHFSIAPGPGVTLADHRVSFRVAVYEHPNGAKSCHELQGPYGYVRLY